MKDGRKGTIEGSGKKGRYCSHAPNLWAPPPSIVFTCRLMTGADVINGDLIDSTMDIRWM